MLRNKPNEILELGRTSPGSPNLLPLSPMDDVIRKEKVGYTNFQSNPDHRIKHVLIKRLAVKVMG